MKSFTGIFFLPLKLEKKIYIGGLIVAPIKWSIEAFRIFFCLFRNFDFIKLFLFQGRTETSIASEYTIR